MNSKTIPNYKDMQTTREQFFNAIKRLSKSKGLSMADKNKLCEEVQ